MFPQHATVVYLSGIIFTNITSWNIIKPIANITTYIIFLTVLRISLYFYSTETRTKTDLTSVLEIHIWEDLAETIAIAHTLIASIVCQFVTTALGYSTENTNVIPTSNNIYSHQWNQVTTNLLLMLQMIRYLQNWASHSILVHWGSHTQDQKVLWWSRSGWITECQCREGRMRREICR